MAIIKDSPICDHCGQYHGVHKSPEGRLCGNCVLISPELRQLNKKAQAREAKMKADALVAAKKAYDQELKDFNKQSVAEIIQGDK
jgi:hypothetical protein